MILSRPSIGTFLSIAKDALLSYNVTSSSSSPPSSSFHQCKLPSSILNPLTFVIGNESADLDSVCSAIVFAYMSTYFPRPQTNQDTISSQKTQSNFYIPLVNILRSSLRTRPELTAALEYAALNPSQLLSLSDLPTPLPSPEHTRWVLIDHNALTTESLVKNYAERVVGCIDHHTEEDRVPRGEISDQGLEGEPRIVDLNAGSSASLVTNWGQSRWLEKMKLLDPDNLSDHVDCRQADTQLARLALAPILVDTANLKSKTTSNDLSATLFLEQLIMQSEEKITKLAYSRTDLFNQIITAKQNLDSLSFPEILAKDYKKWTIPAESDQTSSSIMVSANLGISAIPQLIPYLITEKSESPSSFLNELLIFGQKRNLSILALMTYSCGQGQENFQRELLLWGLNQRGVQAAQLFEREATSKLRLSSWSYEGLNLNSDSYFNGRVNPEKRVINNSTISNNSNTVFGWRRCWIQRETSSSRKSVAPLLRAALNYTISH